MRAHVLDAVEAAAAPQPDELVAAVPLGRPPRITGAQVQALLKAGPAAAVVAGPDNATRVVREVDHDDADQLVLLLQREAVELCAPLDEEAPRVRPLDLAQELTLRYRREHAACAWNPVMAVTVTASLELVAA